MIYDFENIFILIIYIYYLYFYTYIYISIYIYFKPRPIATTFATAYWEVGNGLKRRTGNLVLGYFFPVKLVKDDVYSHNSTLLQIFSGST